NDAVEVFRISLRLGQALSAALRTSVVIREFRGSAVVRIDDFLGLHGHLMNRSICEIDQLLRLFRRKIGSATDMAGVCSGSRVPGSQGRRKGRIWNGAGPSAIADSLELAIPAGCRKPDFNLDIGVAC